MAQAGEDYGTAAPMSIPRLRNRGRWPLTRVISLYIHPTGNGDSAMLPHTSSSAPRAENRWTGGNRGGWSNPEYDRLVVAYNTTLDRNERIRQVAELTKIFSEDVGAVSLFHTTQITAHTSALRGPRVVASTALMSWDVQDWQFR